MKTQFPMLLLAGAVLLATQACGGGGGGGTDTTLPDSGPDGTLVDPGSPDPGSPDQGPFDPGAVDHGTSDPGSTDSGPSDPGTTDLGPSDPGTMDPGPSDPGATDPGSFDPGTTDFGSGGGTCVDITNCVNQNQCSTQACVQQCVAVGSPQAQGQFEALAQCMVQKCGQYGQNQPNQLAYCVYSQCKVENQPCVVTGNLGCMAMLQCGQGCGQDETCIMNCVFQGTYDAQTTFLSIAACMEQNCPTSPTQQCILQYCMQQALACQGS